METLTTTQAIKKLGQYAKNSRTGALIHNRIEKVINFSKVHGSDFEIEVNNSWGVCPKAASAKASELIGGTTYKYQIWAVVR